VAIKKDGELFNKDFEPPVEQGNWQAVTINVQSYDPHRIEYYQPLTRDGNKRQFKYQWLGDYTVKEFTITIQVPVDSTGLITSPLLQSTAKTTDGMDILGRFIKNELKMGNSFQFALEYQRTSDALTGPSEADQVRSSEPVGADTPGRVTITNLPWVIGAFGLALIGIALFSYWRSTQSSEAKPRRQRRRQPKQLDVVEAYCHECGARAHAGDRFCRTCGSRLRLE
ncbi:MAG TPA: zinc ribbon domain-containing protein, partial [Anaerolineales bacterium]|nr:zinc ribbon domain-containing protein [Anaerolineales bacterium]